MKTNDVTVRGVRLERLTPLEADDHPPLLFVHGAGHGSWVWTPWLPYLADRGYEVVALNWFGRGGSDDLPPAARATRGILDKARETEIAVQTLGRPPVIVAHSMGALASLGYLAEGGCAAGFVGLAPGLPRQVADESSGATFDFDLDAFGLIRTADGLLTMANPPARSADHPDPFHGTIAPESPVAIREAYALSVSVPLERIKVPSLLISGGADWMVPPPLVARLAKAMAAEHVIADKQTHLMHLSRRWATIADLVLGWIESTVPGIGTPTSDA